MIISVILNLDNIKKGGNVKLEDYGNDMFYFISATCFLVNSFKHLCIIWNFIFRRYLYCALTVPIF